VIYLYVYYCNVVKLYKLEKRRII